jgi:hypothetical protein
MVASGHQHGSVGGAGRGSGLECAGEVEAVGSEVEGTQARRPRDGVGAGRHSRNTSSPTRARVHRIPANNMTFEQAACFPVALQTMHNAIVTAGRLKRGETLLMQGASTGATFSRPPLSAAPRRQAGPPSQRLKSRRPSNRPAAARRRPAGGRIRLSQSR